MSGLTAFLISYGLVSSAISGCDDVEPELQADCKDRRLATADVFIISGIVSLNALVGMIVWRQFLRMLS